MHPRALMRGYPPSTLSNRLLRNQGSLLTIVISIPTFRGKGNKVKKGAQRPWERSALQPAHPHGIAPQNIYRLSTAKGSSTPRRTISCCRTPLVECIPCIFRNLFSIHSPCSYFNISLMVEGGEGDPREGGWGGGVFRVLVPTGRRHSNDDGGAVVG